MHTYRSVIILIALSMSLAVSAAAQTGKPEYKFISTNKTSTFENELNAAAKEGYRLAKIAKTVLNSSVAGLVVREQEKPSVLYEYKLLGASKLSTFKKEFEEAVTQGFELRGISSHGNGMSIFIIPEIITLMERPVGEGSRRFEYRLITVKGEKEKQKELTDAVSDGFEPVEMNLGLIILRKTGGAGAENGKIEYRYLETTKVSTMEKEMNKLSEEGFQFHLGSFGSYAIMSRPVTATTRQYEYKLLSTMRTGTMQKELEQVADQGYIYCDRSNGLGGMVAVMQRSLSDQTGKRRYEYKFLATSREETTQKELNEALAAGYQFLDIATVNERLIILGRVVQEEAKATEGARN